MTVNRIDTQKKTARARKLAVTKNLSPGRQEYVDWIDELTKKKAVAGTTRW